MVDLGDKLRALRTEKRLTQLQVAQNVGVTKSVISAYENCVRYPSYSVLRKLASLYNVTADYLLGINNKRSIDITGLTDKQIEVLSNMVGEFKVANKK
jgi:transcriptional regulator with XRE-family HTH domain